MLAVSDRQASGNKRFLILSTHVILLAVLLIVLGLLSENFRIRDVVYAACVMLMLIFIWNLWSWRALTGRLFDPYTLFLIAAALFNGGQAFLEVFGLNQTGILNNRFSPETTFSTISLVSIGLAAFHLGALVVTGRSRNPIHNTHAKFEKSTYDALRFVGWASLIISAFPALGLIREAISVVQSSGYFALFQQEAGTGLEATPQILATFLIPASLFLLAGSERRGTTLFVSLAVVTGYFFVMLFLGRRGLAIPAVVAYAWLWHRLIRPIPRIPLLVSGALVLFLIVPIIGIIRNVPGEQRLSLTYLVDAYSTIENPAVSAVTEFGGTMQTVAYTLDLVPKTRTFENGEGYLYATLTILPNFFWTVHPTIAHGLASDWLIRTVDRFTAERGGALGYSFIAEAYLNFGWWGAPLALAFIGLLYGRLLVWGEKDEDPTRLAAVASFLVFFLFFARAESATVIRGLAWYALIPYSGARIMSQVLPRLQVRL